MKNSYLYLTTDTVIFYDYNRTIVFNDYNRQIKFAKEKQLFIFNILNSCKLCQDFLFITSAIAFSITFLNDITPSIKFGSSAHSETSIPS